jgi:hypothetical protein
MHTERETIRTYRPAPAHRDTRPRTTSGGVMPRVPASLVRA